MSEVIVAAVKYEADVISRTANAPLGRASGAAESSIRSSWDTTEYAPRVVHDALLQSLGQFVRDLDKYQ